MQGKPITLLRGWGDGGLMQMAGFFYHDNDYTTKYATCVLHV